MDLKFLKNQFHLKLDFSKTQIPNEVAYIYIYKIKHSNFKLGLLTKLLLKINILRLCLATCKIIFECKIFSVESILQKGKHFHLCGCVLGNTPQKYLWCLVLQCKTFSRENVKKYL